MWFYLNNSLDIFITKWIKLNKLYLLAYQLHRILLIKLTVLLTATTKNLNKKILIQANPKHTSKTVLHRLYSITETTTLVGNTVIPTSIEEAVQKASKHWYRA